MTEEVDYCKNITEKLFHKELSRSNKKWEIFLKYFWKADNVEFRIRIYTDDDFWVKDHYYVIRKCESYEF